MHSDLAISLIKMKDKRSKSLVSKVNLILHINNSVWLISLEVLIKLGDLVLMTFFIEVKDKMSETNGSRTKGQRYI